MKRINRSMVCREVASLAKRVERGGVCSGHDGGGISTAGAIQGKYITIKHGGNDQTVLVFDTEQECVDALRSLTEALVDNQYPIVTVKAEGVSYLVYPATIYTGTLSIPEPGITLPGTDINITSTTRIGILNSSAYSTIRLTNDAIVLSQLSYNVNNTDDPIVMTKEYVTKNYPTAKLNDFTIRFI